MRPLPVSPRSASVPTSTKGACPCGRSAVPTSTQRACPCGRSARFTWPGLGGVGWLVCGALLVSTGLGATSEPSPAAPPLQAAAPVLPAPAPFFEASFPFFQTAVDLHGPEKGGPDNMAVRGILLPLEHHVSVVFDQDLLRVAAVCWAAEGQPPITLKTMAQTSYAEVHRKAGADQPKPTGAIVLGAGRHPGVAPSLEALFVDPRMPGAKGETGLGPLPVESGRFEGIELAEKSAVLSYRSATTAIREWFEARTIAVPLHGSLTVVFRHLEIGAHEKPLFFSVGNPVNTVQLVANSKACTFVKNQGETVAQIAPSKTPQRLSIALGLWPESPAPTGEETNDPLAILLRAMPTPARPAISKTARWPEAVPTPAPLQSLTGDGLVFDRIALPETNPWQRRVRPADLAFLSADRAAVLTYDGDVWLLDGVADPALAHLHWKRFASGLSEPLAMVATREGILQVATKHGLVRLYDRDKNGEADWYENFSDLVKQSQSTRAFPLDMDLAPDGSTYSSQGGIALGGAGNEFGGAIAKTAPDGRSLSIVSTHAREPYVTVHPRSGLLTGTDQQGNFIPSSLCYLIRPGDNFGFGQDKPPKLTLPLVWIPHTADNSSASQLWLTGAGMGALRDKLIHLSYGTGRIFLVSPDLDAPTPQGAVIPIALDTNVPLLHARRHPSGESAFLCGFQIYDSRTSQNWGLGRLRLSGSEAFGAPIEARSCKDGVILSFAAPLDPATVNADHVSAAVWNYLRSSKYGSARYKPDGSEGSEEIAVGQVVLSADKKSVFIHLPTLAAVMQLEVRHSFALAGATAPGAPQPAERSIFFTIHEPRPMDLQKAGFIGLDLGKSVPRIRERKEEAPSIAQGKTLSNSMGCIACHSIDGTLEGKTGPSWKGLFGRDVSFTDGSIESANEFYLRDSILDPQKKIVTGFLPGMASYRGILNESQIASIILYIRALKAP